MLLELTSTKKVIQRRREIDEARIAGESFMENLGFELYPREGSTISSGRKVGMSTECVRCVLSSRLSCGD